MTEQGRSYISEKSKRRIFVRLKSFKCVSWPLWARLLLLPSKFRSFQVSLYICDACVGLPSHRTVSAALHPFHAC